MVKLKGLIEEVFGKKYVVQTSDGDYPILLSKNVIPGEQSWRITVFDAYSYKTHGKLIPITHMEIDENEAGKLASTSKLSQRIEFVMTRWLAAMEDCDFKGIVPA
jgi:hypothetical protein